jgi:hypothetical protein
MPRERTVNAWLDALGVRRGISDGTRGWNDCRPSSKDFIRTTGKAPNSFRNTSPSQQGLTIVVCGSSAYIAARSSVAWATIMWIAPHRSPMLPNAPIGAEHAMLPDPLPAPAVLVADADATPPALTAPAERRVDATTVTRPGANGDIVPPAIISRSISRSRWPPAPEDTRRKHPSDLS